jgi:hypothetical protein
MFVYRERPLSKIFVHIQARIFLGIPGTHPVARQQTSEWKLGDGHHLPEHNFKVSWPPFNIEFIL